MRDDKQNIKELDKETKKKVVECLREDCSYSYGLRLLFNAEGVNVPDISKDDNLSECAKAFFIKLAIDTFGLSSESDIILCAIGLLNGYDAADGRKARFVQYFKESNYQFNGKKTLLPNKLLPDERLEKTAADFYHTAEKYVREMLDHFVEIEDKNAFLQRACEQYLEMPKNGQGFRQVRLPNPSYYAPSFEKPARYIPLLESPDFYGRDDYISAIGQLFSNKYERRTLVLHGMDGVGKTEIALQYTEKNLENYSTVIWLDASSIDTLKHECMLFLRKYGSVPSTESVALSFNEFVGGRTNALIVFDSVDYTDTDAETGKTMAQCIRMMIPKEKGHVIITTSMNVDSRANRALEVGVLAPEPALKLLSAKAGMEADSYAEQLVKRLGYLPLAINYAGAYIRNLDISYAEYLQKWDDTGTTIFDQADAEMPIRKAFNIALERVKDIKWAPEFLRFVSEVGATRLPLKDFLDEIRKTDYLTIQKLDDHPVYVVPDDGTGRAYLVKKVLPDGSLEAEAPADGDMPGEKKIISPDPFLRALYYNSGTRDSLILALKRFSLIDYQNGNVIMHPLLQEIVFDEYYHENRKKWISKHSPTGFLYQAYLRSGDGEGAKEKLFEMIQNGMRSIEKSTHDIPRMAEKARSEGYKLHNIILDMFYSDHIVEMAEKYGDDELTMQCKKLRQKLVQVLYDTIDVSSCDEPYEETYKQLINCF